MGFYSLLFTVPANTAEVNAYEQTLQCTGGIIHQVSVLIPPGHAGLTGVAIDEGLHQIAPSNQNEWFRGDDVHYSYPEYHELPPDTRSLVIRGFNLDTANNHAFVVGVGIMPRAVYDSWVQLAKTMQPMIGDIALIKQFFGPPQSGSGP